MKIQQAIITLGAFVVSSSLHATTVFPTSVTSSTTSDFRPASNTANGIGLDANELHIFNTNTSAWVTAASAPDYFVTKPAIVLTVDLGADVSFDEFLTWAYSAGSGTTGQRQGNTVKDYSLRFATEAEGIGGFGTSITLNLAMVVDGNNVPAFPTTPYTATPYVIPADVQDLGQTVTARYISMTITDNFFGVAGFKGGDRTGLGAIGVNVVPESSLATLIALSGVALGLRRRR